MNAREAMQALLDGKIVVTDGYTRYVLNDEGYVGLDHGPIRAEPCGSFLNSVVEVIEKYPLTFEQALRAMLDGKVVSTDLHPIFRHRFHDGCFECKKDEDDEWLESFFTLREQRSKWRVVE